MTEVNILGTKYSYREDDLNNPDLAGADGICELFDKEIIVRKKEFMAGKTEQARNYRFKHVLRHELIHAFAQEAGVQYGEDEALVDWIAAIIPRVNKAVAEVYKSEE